MTPLSPIAAPRPGRVRVLEVLGNAIVGGMETCVLRLVERLPPDRFTVTALCPFESELTDRLRTLGVEVLTAPMPLDASWPSLLVACSVVQAGAIDVLHAHMPNAHLLAGVAGRLCGRPVLATLHSRHVSPMDLEVHRAAGTHLSVVCQHSYFHALSMGVNAAQLSCIPNGVDTDVFTPGGRNEAGLRRHFGMADDAPLIGFVGRLSAEKGPEVFMRAVLLMRGLLPDARYVMVGDGPEQRQLQDFAQRFGLADVILMAGLRTDMPAVYRELDVLVSTSHSEAMPLALMEAMASGVPVVGTRVGGVSELVEQGGTGWLVSPGNFEGVARQVAQIMQTPGERQRMGERARARSLSRMGLAQSVNATANLLSRLALQRDAPVAVAAVSHGTPLQSVTALSRTPTREASAG